MNFLRTGQWEGNQDELISCCFCHQDTVISNYVQVFDDRARFWSKQGHPRVLGRLGERSLHHLVCTQTYSPFALGEKQHFKYLANAANTWAKEKEGVQSKTFSIKHYENERLSKTKHCAMTWYSCPGPVLARIISLPLQCSTWYRRPSWRG